jgi:hypothetical protein
MTAGQRAIVAAKALPPFEEAAKERMSEGGKNKGGTNGATLRRSRDDVAKVFKVGVNQVQQAKALLANAADLAERVALGTVDYAARVLTRFLRHRGRHRRPRAVPRAEAATGSWRIRRPCGRRGGSPAGGFSLTGGPVAGSPGRRTAQRAATPTSAFSLTSPNRGGILGRRKGRPAPPRSPGFRLANSLRRQVGPEKVCARHTAGDNRAQGSTTPIRLARADHMSKSYLVWRYLVSASSST